MQPLTTVHPSVRLSEIKVGETGRQILHVKPGRESADCLIMLDHCGRLIWQSLATLLKVGSTVVITASLC